ncbi:MAG: hypothetical protein KDK70_39805 [Myxococcales bacterium]|nr:hypothetical protein [Myxococcales bacterium]
MTVDPSIDDAALLPTWILERNPDMAERLDVPGHVQWIAIRISGSTYDYRVTTTALRDGDVVGSAAEPVVCDGNSEALLGVIDEEIKRALLQLESMPAEVTASEPEPEPEPPPPPKQRTTLTKLGVGGIVTASLGVAGLGTGIAFVALGVRPVDDYPDWVERDHGPPGYALLSVGIAAMGAGAAMLALDLTRCKRRSDAPKCPQADQSPRGAAASRRPRLSVVATPHAATLLLGGRF